MSNERGKITKVNSISDLVNLHNNFLKSYNKPVINFITNPYFNIVKLGEDYILPNCYETDQTGTWATEFVETSNIIYNTGAIAEGFNYLTNSDITLNSNRSTLIKWGVDSYKMLHYPVIIEGNNVKASAIISNDIINVTFIYATEDATGNNKDVIFLDFDYGASNYNAGVNLNIDNEDIKRNVYENLGTINGFTYHRKTLSVKASITASNEKLRAIIRKTTSSASIEFYPVSLNMYYGEVDSQSLIQPNIFLDNMFKYDFDSGLLVYSNDGGTNWTNFDGNTISSMTDTNITALEPGQILKSRLASDGVTVEWTNEYHVLDNLVDTQVQNTQNNQVLINVGTSEGNIWKNEYINLDKLSDVIIGQPLPGDALSYNATTSKWGPGFIANPPTEVGAMGSDIPFYPGAPGDYNFKLVYKLHSDGEASPTFTPGWVWEYDGFTADDSGDKLG